MLDFFEKGPALIVLLLGILVFGSSRLPGAARSLGQSMRILKAETKGLKDDDSAPSDDTDSGVGNAALTLTRAATAERVPTGSDPLGVTGDLDAGVPSSGFGAHVRPSVRGRSSAAAAGRRRA